LQQFLHTVQADSSQGVPGGLIVVVW